MARVVQLKIEFREILFRNVCMSLFENHKLLFAFFIALKVFESGETLDGSFGEKLKQLERMGQLDETSNSGKQFDTSSRASDPDHTGTKYGASSGLKKTGAYSKISASIKGADELAAAKLILKDEERFKVNDDLLNFTLTGLLPQGLSPYSNDPNPDSFTFSELLWKDIGILTAFDCFENI